ncbi:MAG TPA: DUF5522 domain-containing protein [Chitinophagales bacterium]|nr:DUF5522 domain-containing protein [Chitinophagales bacterium]
MSFEHDKNAYYYFDKNGLMVFTAKYLLERGYCCKNGCRHCPYGFNKNPKKDDTQTGLSNSSSGK